MKVKCYPKVNLNLFITGKKDNLHELDSVFVEVEGDLYDELEVNTESGDGIEIIISKDIDNLNLYKCYELMKSKLNKKVIVNLTKNIPTQSGLGGGSSNAAAFLNCLNNLFDLEMTDIELMKIASQVGSDVPFFINGGIARVQGTGHIIKPILATPPLINLYLNDFKFSTKEVFDKFYERDCNVNTMDKMLEALKNNNVTNDLLVNDLLKSTYRVDQKFEKFVVKNKKYLSGSGSTLFEIVN